MSSDDRTKSNPKITRTPPPIAPTMECGAAIGSNQMAAFLTSFQQSARRWEIIVYPALFAFIVLAMYGFFLIYSLTSDMARISNSIDPDMGQHMTDMSNSIVSLSEQVQVMSVKMTEVSNQMAALKPMLKEMQTISAEMQALQPMLVEIRSLNKQISVLKPILHEMRQINVAVGGMRNAVDSMDKVIQSIGGNLSYLTANTSQMRHDMTSLNHSIGRPMSLFRMFPF